MHRRRGLAAVTTVLLLASSQVALADDVGFLRAWESIHGADLARHIEVLASDAYEGRGPGTAAEEKTLAYLQAAFVRAGAKPALPGGYLQYVPLVELTRTGTPRLSIAGPGGRDRLVPGVDVVIRAARPIEGVALERVPLVFAGLGITAPEENWDDYAGERLEGSAVLLIRGEPADSADTTLFRGRALTTHGLP